MKYTTTHPIAREALPFLAIGGLLTLGFLVLGAMLSCTICYFFSALGLLASCYVLWFFRHPRRPLQKSAQHLLSPADGTITSVGIVSEPTFPQGQALRVAVFMSLFNVHINWAPCDATVEEIEYFPGKFINAMDDKSSEVNERKVLRLKLPTGEPIVVKLVAGLVARRIVSPIERGDILEQGETIGLIRFGSRVEVLAPTSYRPKVEVGDKVVGRVSILMEKASAAKDFQAGEPQ
jgi:phosphatidylserine decarboxylase